MNFIQEPEPRDFLIQRLTEIETPSGHIDLKITLRHKIYYGSSTYKSFTIINTVIMT